jgi:hypothetical protein
MRLKHLDEGFENINERPEELLETFENSHGVFEVRKRVESGMKSTLS